MLNAVLAVMSSQVSWLSCAIFFLPAAYFLSGSGSLPPNAGRAQCNGVLFKMKMVHAECYASWMQNIAHRCVLQPENLAVNSGWEKTGEKLKFATV